MRAAIYVRISQDSTGQALGVTRQLEDCKQLADGLGWEVAEVYTDNDISATSGKVRPAYKRLLADIAAGRVDALVVWSPDRLYRRTADLETLIPVIEDSGITVRTVKAGDLDLSSAYGRMIARILGAIATGEGEVKAERWKRSWRQGREHGAPVTNSSRLFGYDRDGVTVLPDEAAVTQDMAQRLLAGATQLSVVRWLDESGVRTTQGGVWTPQGMKRYLTNPRIAGWSTLKGEILGEGTWEPVIDRETWESVRALLSSKTRAFVPRKSVLTGLIVCGICDQRMVTSSYGPGARNYRCPKRPNMPGCGRVSGHAEKVEQVVEGFARARLQDPAVRARIEELRSSPTNHGGELAALEVRVTELEQQLDQPGVPVAALLRAIERAKERQAELLDAMAATPRQALPRTAAEWPTDIIERRALVDLVVERVHLNPASGARNTFDPERVAIDPR